MPIGLIFQFLKSPLAKWIAIALVLAGLVFGIYRAGANSVQEKWDAANAKVEQEKKEQAGKSDAVTNDSNAKGEAAVKTITVKGDTIVKYVNKYITKESDRDCTVPIGAIRMHDDSINNTVPKAASQPNGSTGGIRAPIAESQ
jgi:hypothetical protein